MEPGVHVCFLAVTCCVFMLLATCTNTIKIIRHQSHTCIACTDPHCRHHATIALPAVLLVTTITSTTTSTLVFLGCLELGRRAKCNFITLGLGQDKGEQGDIKEASLSYFRAWARWRWAGRDKSEHFYLTLGLGRAKSEHFHLALETGWDKSEQGEIKVGTCISL